MASILLLGSMILPPIIGVYIGTLCGSGRYLFEKCSEHEMSLGYFYIQIISLFVGIIGIISGPILSFAGFAHMWEQDANKGNGGKNKERPRYGIMAAGMVVSFGGSFLLTRCFTIISEIINTNILKMLVQ